MTDLTSTLPEKVSTQIVDTVLAEARSESSRLARGVALRVIATLGMASYALWTLTSGEHDINTYAYAAVAALAGLLAADSTLRMPQLAAALAARSNPMGVSVTPSTKIRWVLAVAALSMWILPLTAATGALWAGFGLAVAILPLVVFSTNVVLRSSLGLWSRLPRQTAYELMNGGASTLGDDDEADEEADEALGV